MLGSALGGLARWGIGESMLHWLGDRFPYGTLLINISGSLFLGWLYTVLDVKLAGDDHAWLRHNLRLLLGVGFTGAYTTFSTFEYEAHRLLDHRPVASFAYMALSLVLGLAAIRMGVYLARCSWA